MINNFIYYKRTRQEIKKEPNYGLILAIFLIFFLNPFLGVLASIFIVLSEKKGNLFQTLIIILSLFLGFINATKIPESDLLNYQELFFDVRFYSLKEYLLIYDREYFFYLISYISYYLFGGSWKLYIVFLTSASYFLLLNSVLIIFKKITIIKSKILFGLLSVALFYPLFSISAHVIRQFLAASMLLFFTVEYLFNKKTRWLLLFFAILTHATALLFLVVFIIPSKFKFNWIIKGLILVTIASILFYVGNNQFLEKTYLVEKYEGYQKNSSGLIDINEAFLILITSMFTLIVFFRTFNMKKYIWSKEGLRKLLFLLLFILLSGLLLASQVQMAGFRILFYSYYFIPVFLVIFLYQDGPFLLIARTIFLLLIICSFVYKISNGVWHYAPINRLLTSSLSFFITA